MGRSRRGNPKLTEEESKKIREHIKEQQKNWSFTIEDIRTWHGHKDNCNCESCKKIHAYYKAKEVKPKC